MRRALLLLAVAFAAGCADDGEPVPGFQDPCLGSMAPILGCPPPSVSTQAFTIEDACDRLVECGAIALDIPEDEWSPDWIRCVQNLRGDEFSADRLEFTLRCIEVSTCQDLQLENGFRNPCLVFGGEPPAP